MTPVCDFLNVGRIVLRLVMMTPVCDFLNVCRIVLRMDMHRSTDRIVHTMTSAPVVEHWMDREITQWGPP